MADKCLLTLLLLEEGLPKGEYSFQAQVLDAADMLARSVRHCQVALRVPRSFQWYCPIEFKFSVHAPAYLAVDLHKLLPYAQGLPKGEYSLQAQGMDAAGVLGTPSDPWSWQQDPSLQAATKFHAWVLLVQGLPKGEYSFQAQGMDAAGVLGTPSDPWTWQQDPSLQAATESQVCL